MPEELSDRAVAVLAADPRLVIPLRELAAMLGTAPELLQTRLDGDRRFALVPTPGLPDLSGLAEPVRAAYRTALDAAGLPTGVRVFLRQPTAPPPRPAPDAAAGVCRLLHETQARLLDGPGALPLLGPAQRVGAALRANPPASSAPPDPPSSPSQVAGRAPSTSPPPGLRARQPAAPARQREPPNPPPPP